MVDLAKDRVLAGADYCAAQCADRTTGCWLTALITPSANVPALAWGRHEELKDVLDGSFTLLDDAVRIPEGVDNRLLQLAKK